MYRGFRLKSWACYTYLLPVTHTLLFISLWLGLVHIMSFFCYMYPLYELLYAVLDNRLILVTECVYHLY